ncbi:MAG: ROK family protein [Sphingobacteriaceae bacterium]|nr:ROK family protein [Sphingobacteriaceae bacterium]
MSEPIIGVNIEDNHISVGLVNIETRKVLTETVQRKRVDPTGSADQIIATWSKVLQEVAGGSKQIGIGVPGLCDYNTGVYLHKDTNRYFSLYKSNLKEIFSSAIGAAPQDVKIMNDAACFLQGEVFGGSGRGFKSSLGVTLGVGLGTAIYANGIVTDANLHSSPFLDNTAEDYISIRWLLSRFTQLTGMPVKDMSELKQYADTDSRFKDIFEEFSANLAQFLIAFIRKNSPEVVVVGGFMELYNRFFFDSATAKVAAAGIKLPVLRAILGEQASILGAASAWYSASQIHA